MSQPGKHRAIGGAARSTRTRPVIGLLISMLAGMVIPLTALSGVAHAANASTNPCDINPSGCTPVTAVQLPDTSGCEGVKSTPGSENTDKVLVGGTLQPGGTAEFVITYPVDPSDVTGRTTFVITDCVFVNDVAILKYQISFVPNTTFTLLSFSLNIPTTVSLGSTYCNYAKTTAAPSTSQASNRKAGPACFVVGGNVRIEKRASDTGNLLAGATFSVSCTPTQDIPHVIINFLGGNSYTANNATDVAPQGVITISGPSGTPCTVTETQPPPGYTLPTTTTQNVTIDASQVQTLTFTDTPAPGSLRVQKTSDAPGTFSFTVDCPGTAFDRTASNPLTVTVTTAGGTATSDTISGIPAGDVCTVAEVPNPLFATQPSQQVTIVSGTTVTVSFTNTRLTGSLAIAKTSDAPGTFSFTVDCDGTAFDQTVTVTVSTANSTSTSSPITGIPTGTSCTVTEQPNSLFTTQAAQTITIQTGLNTVSFTNTRKVGSLAIAKASDAPGTFSFTVDCDGTTFDQTVTVTVSTAGTTSTSTPITGIPTGTSCTVTELPNADFLPQPAQTITIVEGLNTVTFTNVARTFGLSLAKTVDGVTANTAQVGQVLTYAFIASTTGNSSQTNATVSDVVPTGTTYVAGSATCTAPCTASYDSATNTLTWHLGTVAPNISIAGLTFQATVDAAAAGTTITDVGTILSTQVASVESNKVTTVVPAVLGVRIVRVQAVKASKLPFTGSPVPVGPALGLAALLVAAGALMHGVSLPTKRRTPYVPRHAKP